MSTHFAKGKYSFLCSLFKHLGNTLHGLLCLLPQPVQSARSPGAHMAAGAEFVHADSTTGAWLHRPRHQQERAVPRQTKAHKHGTKQACTSQSEFITATKVYHTAPECDMDYKNISV